MKTGRMEGKLGRVAVLVDGDNVSASYAGQILTQAEKLGRVDVARVYADAGRSSEWHTTPEYRLIHSGNGKNASDLLLAIDAMEIALTRDIETFLIATSDGDFTHLAVRLRECGHYVLGMGENKAPQIFRKTCSNFVTFAANPKRAANGNGNTSPPEFTELDHKIRDMIAQHSKNGSGMQIAALGQKMYAVHGTRISNKPDQRWRTYLANRPELYDLDRKGPDAMVRFRPDGFNSAK